MKKFRPAAFLDRDGTINVDKDYLYQIKDFEYLDGAIEGLRILQDKGYLLVIITNQSGIARGYYTEKDFHILNDWMISDLKEKGIDIAGVYYCPHHPRAKIAEYKVYCNCRKPNTALFWRAQADLNIDMAHSIAIGDKPRDLCICSEAGMKGYLVGENRLLDIAQNVRDVTLGSMEEKSIRIGDIQDFIVRYESVIVVDDDDNAGIRKLVAKLFFCDGLRKCKKNIMFLGTHSYEGQKDVSYIKISVSDLKYICSLYNTYEFTDRLHIITSTSQYPSMFNYLSTGLLTEEEYFEALIH